MNTLTLKTRIEAVYFTRDSLVVDLVDGRTISVPLTWYPKLLKASPKEDLIGNGVMKMEFIGLKLIGISSLRGSTQISRQAKQKKLERYQKND